MKSRTRLDHREGTFRLLPPLLLSILLIGTLTAAGLARHSAVDVAQDRPSPSIASTTEPSGSLVTVDTPDPRRSTAASNLGQTTEPLYYQDPTAKALTIPQKMERSITQPGIKGVLRGIVTGNPTTGTVPKSSDGQFTWNVVDFPFSVKGFLGPVATPYAIGVPITLRIVDFAEDVSPGQRGQTFGVKTGDELFVYVRDQGVIGGGNTGTVLVASQPYDILTLRNGIVYGNGAWASYAEPLATFEKHFIH